MTIVHRHYLYRLREAEGLDHARFDAVRTGPLHTLIQHIWLTAPFQRERMATLARSSGLDLTHWREIPVLRPADIVRLGERLAAEPVEGTVETAEANDFVAVPRIDDFVRIAAESVLERFYERAGLDPDGRMAIFDPAWRGESKEGRWSVVSRQSHFIVGDAAAPAAAKAAFLADHDVGIVKTTAAIAMALANEPTPPLDALILIDDWVSDATREKLAHRFACPAIHLVSRPVLGTLAMSLAAASPYVTAAASNLIEVVDPTGRPVGPGKRGEVVVTPFHQRVFPLIRLATGLFAETPATPETQLGIRSLAAIVPAEEMAVA